MKVLTIKERNVVTAILDSIRHELDRCYWNKHQCMMDSPFDNTGNSYECGAFKVRAYDWDDNVGDPGDNFVYFKDNLHVDWYKHCGRGMYVEVPDDWTMERLSDMLDDCINAIREEFGEEIDL